MILNFDKYTSNLAYINFTDGWLMISYEFFWK